MSLLQGPPCWPQNGYAIKFYSTPLLAPGPSFRGWFYVICSPLSGPQSNYNSCLPDDLPHSSSPYLSESCGSHRTTCVEWPWPCGPAFHSIDTYLFIIDDDFESEFQFERLLTFAGPLTAIMPLRKSFVCATYEILWCSEPLQVLSSGLKARASIWLETGAQGDWERPSCLSGILKENFRGHNLSQHVLHAARYFCATAITPQHVLTIALMVSLFNFSSHQVQLGREHHLRSLFNSLSGELIICIDYMQTGSTGDLQFI